MKVFLSHSTKDADFVQRLVTALKANAFTPWLCEVDIEKGTNFVAKINDGLAQSDLALLVWSQHAANSAWILEEWTAALARQVEENRIRLGIVLLRDSPMLPLLLRTKNYIDAQWDETSGIRQILEWLEGRQRVQRLSGLRAPVYLPDYRPQDFVGRSAYLAQLRDALTVEPGVFLLYGEPGAGKSTLALRFAWDVQKDFDAVIFQGCGQRPLDAITAELADRLPIDVKTRPPEEQLAAVKAWLRERQSLLVLDDVWSPEVRQLEGKPPCSVLYTSRKHTLPGILAKQSAELEKFTEAEAEELFHTYLDHVFSEREVTQNREALLAFAKRVEWLPIAVAVGASTLREKSATTLGRAVLKLRPDALTDGAKDVNALFRTAIASQPEREQRLLAAGAVCVQEGFWLPLAAGIAELSEDDGENAADRLVHSSLLWVMDRERRRFNLHALLREEVRAQSRDASVKLPERHAAALENLFKDWETRWQECCECLEEIIPALQFLWRTGERDRELRLEKSTFRLVFRVGALDVGFRILTEHESLWAGRDDPETKDVLQRVYGNRGDILYVWGKLDEALDLHKKQELLCLELTNYKGLHRSYNNQARILRVWGKLEAALALYKKAEKICLELGDLDNLSRSYGGHAQTLIAWERLEEALELLKKQEAICVALPNKNRLASSYRNQARILHKTGRLNEAMELCEKQEAICLELGNKFEMQMGYGVRALILQTWERLEDALVFLRKQEHICIELGHNPGLGSCYWHWASLARAQGDRKTEKEKLERALAIFIELNLPRERDDVQSELDNMSLQ
jgi:tetratricopeptide (TPR) repeat protein